MLVGCDCRVALVQRTQIRRWLHDTRRLALTHVLSAIIVYSSENAKAITYSEAECQRPVTALLHGSLDNTVQQTDSGQKCRNSG